MAIEAAQEAGQQQGQCMHAEFFFEETEQICKVLIAPTWCKDSADVISTAINHFGVTATFMVCTTAQSGYGEGYDCMEHFSYRIRQEGSGSLKVPPLESTTTAEGASIAVLLLQGSELNWGKDEKSQRLRYMQKVTDLIQGVGVVKGESGAWLICQGDCDRASSQKSGSIFSRGTQAYKKYHPTAASLVCIGFRAQAHYTKLGKHSHAALMSPYSELVFLDSNEFAVPLSATKPEKQLLYPEVS